MGEVTGMTRAEAIKILEVAQAEVEWEYPMEYYAALEIAINSLKVDEMYDLAMEDPDAVILPAEQSGDPESEKYKLAKRIKEDLVAYISNMHDEHGDVLIEIANDFRNYAAMNGDMEAVR